MVGTVVALKVGHLDTLAFSWLGPSREIPPQHLTDTPACCHPLSLSPRVPLAAEVSLHALLPEPPAGRAEAPGLLGESLPGDKPHSGGHNVFYASCLSTQPRGDGGLPQGPRTREAEVIPMQLPQCFSYLLPLFSLFLLSLSVLFGGCWAGSPTGMLWGNYAGRVAVGCSLGSIRGWAQASVRLSDACADP